MAKKCVGKIVAIKWHWRKKRFSGAFGSFKVKHENGCVRRAGKHEKLPSYAIPIAVKRSSKWVKV